MTPFTTLTAPAAALPAANIDTDQLMPARFMKESRRPDGYGRFLLADARAVGPDPLAGAPRIIAAGRNFGCGSSREAAVYALVDFGVTCVIAPSFGDIFAANAVNNGLLPAAVKAEDGAALLAALVAGAQSLTVDLREQTIAGAGLNLDFTVDPTSREKLLNGWDDIDLTLARADAIAAFADADAARRPWAGAPIDRWTGPQSPDERETQP